MIGTVVNQFDTLSDRLSKAVTPCINGVILGLHAKQVIGFELKDNLISSTKINAQKATDLVNELQRALHNSRNPEELLAKICSVLRDQQETLLNEITDELLTKKKKSKDVFILFIIL